MSAGLAAKPRMTVEEYLDWSQTLPETEHYELVDGIPVAMAGDTARHNLTKGALYQALRDGVAAAALPCVVFLDGVNVRINPWTSRIPDASVQCGPISDLDSMLVEPMIVAEVVSPSSDRDDSGAKLAEYFSVPSVRHYLIVRSEQGLVVHHFRQDGESEIRTALVREGDIRLDPPGLIMAVGPGPERSRESDGMMRHDIHSSRPSLARQHVS